jgi:hypothetical protein
VIFLIKPPLLFIAVLVSRFTFGLVYPGDDLEESALCRLCSFWYARSSITGLEILKPVTLENVMLTAAWMIVSKASI